MATTILPPIPDDWLAVERRAQVFGFIKGLEIPRRYKTALFRRWSELVGAPATDAELRAMRGIVRLEG